MSISKPLSISYRWDQENFKKAFEKSYAHQYKHSVRRYIGWLFIAMAQFGVVAALKGGSVGLLMLSTLLIFYWYVVKKQLVYRKARKAYGNSPLKDQMIRLKVTEAGIEQEGRLIPWEALRGVVPLEDDILLYYGQEAFYIPSGAFASIEEKSALKSLAKEKGRYFDV